MVYSCAIVEDEPLAKEMIQKYINRIDCLKLLWTCSYAEEALELLQQPVDLLFLDLQEVPIHSNGAFMQLIASCKNTIVTSPYPKEVLNRELPVIAFLNKPVAFERFVEAVERFLGE